MPRIAPMFPQTTRTDPLPLANCCETERRPMEAVHDIQRMTRIRTRVRGTGVSNYPESADVAGKTSQTEPHEVEILGAQDREVSARSTSKQAAKTCLEDRLC
jgi:hypothetical protein